MKKFCFWSGIILGVVLAIVGVGELILHKPMWFNPNGEPWTPGENTPSGIAGFVALVTIAGSLIAGQVTWIFWVIYKGLDGFCNWWVAMRKSSSDKVVSIR